MHLKNEVNIITNKIKFLFKVVSIKLKNADRKYRDILFLGEKRYGNKT